MVYGATMIVTPGWSGDWPINAKELRTLSRDSCWMEIASVILVDHEFNVIAQAEVEEVLNYLEQFRPHRSGVWWVDRGFKNATKCFRL